MSTTSITTEVALDRAVVTSRPKGRLAHMPALDGVRGLAFLMVYAFHAAISFHPAFGPEETRPAWINGLIFLGQEGVPLFFVLSAFLVTSILVAERESTGKIDVVAFLIRRALRLLPLYYAVLLITAPFLWSRTPAYPWYLVLNGDLFHAAQGVTPDGGTLLVVWSIGVEEKFYLAWSIALAAILRTRPDRNRVATAAVVTIAFAWVYRLVVAPFVWHAALVYGPFSYLDCFGWGILIALGRWPFPRVRTSVALPAFLVGLWAASLVGLIPGLPGVMAYAISKGLIAIVSGAFLVAMKDATSGWATWGPLRWIGTVSYGAYLFHNLLLSYAVKLPIAPISFASFVAKVVILGLTLGLAALSFRYYETPFLRLKSRFRRTSGRAA